MMRKKERAKAESGVTAACFDLEKVLNCPHGEVSSFYYHRKLSVYNFTVYDLGTGDGSCYVWPEVVAQRGANEIASCLMDYIESRAAQGTNMFELFSDNCGGQNRNRFVAALYWFIVGSSSSVESITHSFLEVGHTQNENDAIHSTIERAARKLQIYTPQQWSAVIQGARRSKPFFVKYMHLSNFFDFKAVSKHVRNFDVADDGSKVNWLKIRSIKFCKADPNIMLVKHSYQDAYTAVDLMRRERRRISAADVSLVQLRTTAPLLSAAKHKDLSNLCKRQLIPPAYHPYFLSLAHCAVSTDDNDDA